MTSKLCACGQTRYRGAKCRECYNQYMRTYMAQRRSKVSKRDKRELYLRDSYNITMEQYEAMLNAQNGRCAICETDKPGQTEWFEVDHDHACCDKKRSCGNCVRALLCTGCNSGISRFRDDPLLLDAAATYLRSHMS